MATWHSGTLIPYPFWRLVLNELHNMWFPIPHPKISACWHFLAWHHPRIIHDNLMIKADILVYSTWPRSFLKWGPTLSNSWQTLMLSIHLPLTFLIFLSAYYSMPLNHLVFCPRGNYIWQWRLVFLVLIYRRVPLTSASISSGQVIVAMYLRARWGSLQCGTWHPIPLWSHGMEVVA